MYIHGIYMVYHGISMDIPSFLKPDFAAGPCCWSNSMRTRVWVIKSVSFHSPPWQLCQGKRQQPIWRGSVLLLSTCTVATIPCCSFFPRNWLSGLQITMLLSWMCLQDLTRQDPEPGPQSVSWLSRDWNIHGIYMVYTWYISCIFQLWVNPIFCEHLSCCPVLPCCVHVFPILPTSIASL